jgi:flavorubredoxin
MTRVLIVYHSQGGNTEAMAKEVSAGATAAGATVILRRAVNANAEDILNCDVVAIGTPNYFGYMAGMVKDFFDRVWATVRDRMAGKPYATFGSKGGGGAQALETVERICDGLKMSRLYDGVLATRKPTEEVLSECRELGTRLAQPHKTSEPGHVEEPRL